MSRNPKIESHRLAACVGIAIATALGVASPAFATDTPAAAAPQPQQTATRASSHEAPETGTLIRRNDNPTNLDTIKVFGGAALLPGDAQWTDHDTAAPELPVARDHDTVKR